MLSRYLGYAFAITTFTSHGIYMGWNKAFNPGFWMSGDWWNDRYVYCMRSRIQFNVDAFCRTFMLTILLKTFQIFLRMWVLLMQWLKISFNVAKNAYPRLLLTVTRLELHKYSPLAWQWVILFSYNHIYWKNRWIGT